MGGKGRSGKAGAHRGCVPSLQYTCTFPRLESSLKFRGGKGIISGGSEGTGGMVPGRKSRRGSCDFG